MARACNTSPGEAEAEVHDHGQPRKAGNMRPAQASQQVSISKNKQTEMNMNYLSGEQDTGHWSELTITILTATNCKAL